MDLWRSWERGRFGKALRHAAFEALLLGAVAPLAAAQAPYAAHLETITLAAGQSGPVFCAAGHLASAEIVGPHPPDLFVFKGRTVAADLSTSGLGGPACAVAAPGQPPATLACFRLSRGVDRPTLVRFQCVR